ncbi:GNAT family N-acetyltransferase [uncultured Polaribacter sp.]|uniref:GNAT family N-acetyltransferase n=1 Tax=uncultured Polaribacter sp. TaxID=174711 RepID=UPI00262AA8AA|nr:GNAT family N-acetyltransferase [uncultured Polaribacter sp.]
MIKVVRTNSKNKDFINLIKELDAYLKITDEDEHDFYNQYNNVDVIKHVVVIYDDKRPVGCAAIKKFNEHAMEIKRMYVSKESRGSGTAQKLIKELESWAKELGYKKCVLETGKRQKEAVKFYYKCNYKVIENYGQYKGMANSICFEKSL